jgi:hypothetical protein
MAANEIHVGGIGTNFQVTIQESGVGVDLSSTTSRTIKFRKPDGTLFQPSGSLVNGGVSGVMQYTSASGDLDQCGKWFIQGYVHFNSNDAHYSDKASFRVYPNL